VRVYTLNREYDVAWALVPHFCARIREFEANYNAAGSGQTQVWRLFQQAFASGDDRMLGIALFTENEQGEPKLAGHMVAGTDLHHGQMECVIWQYEKDVPEDRESIKINDEVQAIVDEWARKLGKTEVSALVISESRARHFKHWGYDYRSSLVTRRIGYGRQGRQEDIIDGSDDPAVAGSSLQTTFGGSDPEYGELHATGAECPTGAASG